VSYSVELALKGLYENTVGRFSGWTSGQALTDEDRYAASVAADYGRFIHIRPWYEYRFAAKLGGLWTEVPLWGRAPIRKWERRFFLTMEYGIKAAYAALITLGTHAAYAPEEDRMQMVVTGWTDSVAARHPTIKVVQRLDSVFTVVAAPRYDEFRDAIRALAASEPGVHISEIAGNHEIFLTGVAAKGWSYTDRTTGARVVFNVPLPTDARRKRVAMRLPVAELLPVLRQLDSARELIVDHIYDY
jgi:hypothetical protein